MTTTDETKDCPKCLSEIPAEAVKCRHCGSDVREPYDWAATRSIGKYTGAGVLMLVVGLSMRESETENVATIGVLLLFLAGILGIYVLLNVVNDVIDWQKRK